PDGPVRREREREGRVGGRVGGGPQGLTERRRGAPIGVHLERERAGLVERLGPSSGENLERLAAVLLGHLTRRCLFVVDGRVDLQREIAAGDDRGHGVTSVSGWRV